jgi:hypothetical protein
VTGVGSKQYAFQIIALNASNKNAGTFSNVPTNTQIVKTGQKFVVEQSAPFDIGSWSFKWTAPSTDSTITFYACGLATNKNGKESGDQAATTSYKLEKTTSIFETSQLATSFSIKNVSADFVSASLNNFRNGNYNVSVLNLF